MDLITCNVNGIDYQLEYAAVIKENHIEFTGTLFMHPPFDFKYVMLKSTGVTSNFEPKNLDKIICDRISFLVSNHHLKNK